MFVSPSCSVFRCSIFGNPEPPVKRFCLSDHGDFGDSPVLQLHDLNRALRPVVLPADNQVAFCRVVKVPQKIAALKFKLNPHPLPSSRLHFAEGFAVGILRPIHVTINPSLLAITPNRNTTPISFTGAKPSADIRRPSIHRPVFQDSPVRGPGHNRLGPPPFCSPPPVLLRNLQDVGPLLSPGRFPGVLQQPAGTSLQAPNRFSRGVRLCLLCSAYSEMLGTSPVFRTIPAHSLNNSSVLSIKPEPRAPMPQALSAFV